MHSEVSSLSPLLCKFIKLFQLLGFFNLSFSSSPQEKCRNERLLFAWSLFFFLCFNVFVIYVFTSNEDFLFLSDPFNYFNDVLKLSFAHAAIIIIYLESLLRRNQLHRFWALYTQLHKPQNVFEQASQSWRQHSRFLGIFIFLNSVSLISWLIYLCFVRKFTIHLVLFWPMFAPYIYVVHYRNMQFILHMEIMRLELVTLKEDLRLLGDYTRFASRVVPFSGFEEFLRRKLLYKQMIYSSIYEMFESFQGAFGFSIIASLLKIAVRVLVDAYFIFYVINKDLPQLAETALIVPAILEIPAFFLTARNCMNVVKHITYELHNIVGQDSSGSILSTQVQNFSLQMLHQQIRIEGVGISRMDGYMLMRAIGSVTIYMIFFIQFMPKSRDV